VVGVAVAADDPRVLDVAVCEPFSPERAAQGVAPRERRARLVFDDAAMAESSRALLARACAAAWGARREALLELLRRDVA